jgi:hypothetical protein
MERETVPNICRQIDFTKNRNTSTSPDLQAGNRKDTQVYYLGAKAGSSRPHYPRNPNITHDPKNSNGSSHKKRGTPMKDSRLSSKGLDRVTLPKKDLLHSHSTTTKGTGSRHFGTLMEKHTEDRKHYRVDLKDSLKKAEIPFFVKVPSSRHLSPARPGEKPSLLNHSTSLGSKTGITKRSSSLLANDYNPRKETKPSHSPKFTKKSLKHTHLDAHSIVASQKNLLLMKDKPEISRFSPQKRSQKKTPMRAQDTSPIQTISFRGNLSNESPSRQRQKQSEPVYQREKFDHYLQQAD